MNIREIFKQWKFSGKIEKIARQNEKHVWTNLKKNTFAKIEIIAWKNIGKYSFSELKKKYLQYCIVLDKR